ncbi:hypothetical protein [Vulgatibacter sp.]|uniref:hypothetical protein n=1 Tax=Vulgatibacter sp. TaxID=1971226 RepID=UPI0035631519
MSSNPTASSMTPSYEEAHAPGTQGIKIHWEAARSKRAAMIGFVVGAIGVALTLIGIGVDRTAAFGSWIFAYMLFLAIALGSMFFVLMHHITASRWGTTVRRLAEASMSTLPLFALLFVPVLVGLHDLFHWTHAEDVAKDAILTAKAPYLNIPFFYIRAFIYFAVWIGLSVYLTRKSALQDKGNGLHILGQMRTASAPGMLLFALSLTFAAFDWLMSLSPHWFSTIFGVYYFAGAVQGALAMIIIVAMFLQRAGLVHRMITVEHYHDLGKLLFGFTVFFAYIAFSQYFLIWYANIPEETEWFLHRWGPWAGLSIALIFFTFVLPFFVLLSRVAKRTAPILLLGALLVLVGRAIDMYWLVMPSLDHHGHGPHLSWMNFTALLGIGGLYVGLLCWRLGKNALVPVGDPLLRSSMGHENV